MLRDSLFGFKIFPRFFFKFLFCVSFFYYLVLVRYVKCFIKFMLWFSALVVMVTSGLYNSALKSTIYLKFS